MRIVSFFLLFFPLTLSASSLTLEQFQARMKAHLETLSKKTTVSMQVEVLGTNQELFSHGASSNLIPASNAKLITSLAALERLGAGYTYQTKVWKSGEDLVIQGNGDPYLVSEKLYLLARDVARSGLKKINSIKVNNSAYQENYRGLIEWDSSGEPFTAVVSPTSINFNSLEIHVIPEKEGSRPRLELGPVPHGYGILKNEVTQVSGNRKSLQVRPLKIEGDKEGFVVSGKIGREAGPQVVYGAVTLSESHLAHIFAALLRKEGIEVKQDFGGSSHLPWETAKEDLAVLESPPLIDLVRLLNTFSNNFMTEQIFQSLGAAALGGQSSLGKSREVINDFLKKRTACQTANIDNGSGLSWNTKVSAKCFSDTLQTAYRDFGVFADLVGSLPVGGQTGTLKTRFLRLGPTTIVPKRVRAKTGTLWSKQVVTSLVGFTQAASGEPLVFALIENDSRNDVGLVSALKDWEDKCVEFMQLLKL